MAITNVTGLIDFLDFFLKKLDEILADGRVTAWRDLPKFILILLKVKTAIVCAKGAGSELSNMTDSESQKVVIRLQATCKRLADLIEKHDTVQTSDGLEVDWSGFSEAEFKLIMDKKNLL